MLSQSISPLLLLIALVVLVGHVQQFKVPQNGGYVPRMEPGAADFAWTFSATQALKNGENPYTHTNQEYFDPYGRFNYVGNKKQHVGYLPTHLLLYLPLAFVTDYWMEAANYFLLFNLLLIVLLAWVTTRLVQKLGADQRVSHMLPMLILSLGLFNGTLFAFERGQSDLVTATLIWGGILLFLSERYAAAGLVLFGAAALKGYGALLWGVILIASIPGGAWRRYLVGSSIAFMCCLAPVIYLLPDALELMTNMVGSDAVTVNPLAYSFRNLSRALDADYIATVALLGASFAVVLVLASVFFGRVKELRLGAQGDLATAVVILTTCAVILPLGASNAAYTYSLVIILPGFVILGLAYEQQWQNAGKYGFSELFMFFWIALIVALAFKLNIRGISSAAIANLLFIPFAIVAASRDLSHQRR